jgi:hypothetical protein
MDKDLGFCNIPTHNLIDAVKIDKDDVPVKLLYFALQGQILNM